MSITGISGMTSEELRALYEQRKADAEIKQKTVDETQQNKETAETNKETAETNLETARTNKDNAASAVDSAQAAYDAEDNNCRQISSSIQTISQQLSNPNLDDAVRENLLAEYGRLTQELEAAEDKRQKAKEDLDAAKTELAKAEAELAKREEELTVATNELTTATNAYDTASQELSDIKAELEELEAAIKEAEEAEAAAAADAAEGAAHISEEEALAQGYTVLKTVDDLIAMAENPSGKYILMNDIDIGGINWVPICGKENPFTGELNGNGYSIKNLTITADEGAENVGFFGVTENATITNINFDNATVNADYDDSSSVGIIAGTARGTQFSNINVTGSVTGYESVGGLAGTVNDNDYIDELGVLHSVTNSSFSNIDTNVDINAQYYTGGLVGYVVGSSTGEGVATRELRITNCHTDGNITLSGESAGGLIGEAGKTLITVIDSGSNANMTWNYDDEYEYSWLEGTGRLGGIIGNANGTYLTLCNTFYTGTINADTTFKGDDYGWYMNDSQITIYDIPAGLPVDDILNIDGIDGMQMNANGQYEVTVSTLTGLDKMVSMIQQNPELADLIVFNVTFDFEAMDGAYDASTYAQYGVVQHIYEDEEGNVHNDVYVDNEVDMETTFHYRHYSGGSKSKIPLSDGELLRRTMVSGLYKDSSNNYVVNTGEGLKTVNLNFNSGNQITSITKRLESDQVRYREHLTSIVLYYQEQMHNIIREMFGLQSNAELPKIGPAEYKKLAKKLKEGKELTDDEKLAMVVYETDYAVINAFGNATNNRGCGMGGNASFLEADTAYQMKDSQGRLLFTTLGGAELVQKMDDDGNPLLDDDGNFLYEYADGSGDYNGINDIYAKRGYQVQDDNGNLLFTDADGKTVTQIKSEDSEETRYVYIDEDGNETPFEGDPETDLERQLEEYDLVETANQLQNDMEGIINDLRNGKYPIDRTE